MTAPPRDSGRWGVAFAAIWLFYLTYPFEEALHHRDTATGWIAMVAIVAFAVNYLASFYWVRARHLLVRPGPPVGPALWFLTTAIVLAVLICIAVGQPGTATVVYLAVMAVFYLPH